MIKKRAKTGRKTGEATRQQIIEAALATLKNEGFAAATSREIARAGGFNPALIFYHFGSIDALLLAALDRTSAERLERYRQAVAEAETMEELVAVAARVYAEDRDSGHMTVVAQMIAGSIARPELAPAMVARMEPWIELCEEALAKVLARLEVPQLIPLRELAYAFVTFYLGVNLLTNLDEDRTRTDALFARLTALAPLVSSLSRDRSSGEEGLGNRPLTPEATRRGEQRTRAGPPGRGERG
jgi:AcrR family transcriptional regulator